MNNMAASIRHSCLRVLPRCRTKGNVLLAFKQHELVQPHGSLTYSRFSALCSVQAGCRQKHHPEKLVGSTNLRRVRQLSTENKDDDLDALYRKVVIEVKGHDKSVLNSYLVFVKTAAAHLGITTGRLIMPPKAVQIETMLSSVHIYSKFRTQYEMRTHFRIFELKHLTGSTADTYLEYIQRNLPEGVAMKVTKHKLEKIPEHLTPPQREATGESC